MDSQESPPIAIPAAPRRFAAQAQLHPALFQVLVFCVAVGIAISRRTDAILHAQFWAEDGKFWYADAYNFGLRSLVMPEAGYLHTVPRIVALIAMALPFVFAPLFMNLCGLIFQVLPVNFFLSSRFRSIGLGLRLLVSFCYLAIPNSYEIHANTTNIQWHLALVACMVLLSQSESGSASLVDLTILVIVSIDSPLGLLLLPIAGLRWWRLRSLASRYALMALLPGSMLQFLLFYLSHSRRPAVNGATVSGLISMLGTQVVLSGLVGARTCLSFMAFDYHFLLFLETIVTLLGTAIVLRALRDSPWELKLFICYAILVLFVCLLHPLASTDGVRPQWDLMRTPGIGSRYFFFPMLAFLGSLFWIAVNERRKLLRFSAIALLLLTPRGMASDWVYPPFRDLSFPKYAGEFRDSPAGTVLTIPINPDWQMSLSKH
jgi:hypothetical protein